jgi:quinol monooxygenase YgiN
VYGVTFDVPAPSSVYDAVHAEVLRETGGDAAGLLVHVGRSTAEGFQVIEVWDSRESYDAYYQTVMPAILARTAGNQAGPPPAQSGVEIDVRGLVIPGRRVVV